MSDTSTHTFSFYGLTVLEEAVISAITAPAGPGREPVAYSGDEAGLAGATLPAGLYLPLRGGSLHLASGSVIAWIE